MIRRIIEIEPHAGEMETPFVPLQEARLQWKNKELIPDSFRTTAEYQGYRYDLEIDVPRVKLFVLNVIPTHYKPGMPSFHAFPVNPDGLDDMYPYVIYCISMGDKGGRPATENDRHFHRKSLWYRLRKK